MLVKFSLTVFLFFPHFILGKKRKEHFKLAVSDEEYEIMVNISNGEFNIPVKDIPVLCPLHFIFPPNDRP